MNIFDIFAAAKFEYAVYSNLTATESLFPILRVFEQISQYKSIRGHTGAIVISNGNFVTVYPTASKGDQDSTESLRRFTKDVGIPANLKVDMALAFVG